MQLSGVFYPGAAFTILLLLASGVLLCAATSLKSPTALRVQHIWPGQVQVVWLYDDPRDVLFTVQYTAGADSAPHHGSETVLDQRILVLDGLRAHTNYSVTVSAQKGKQVVESKPVFAYVREGVPWPPSAIAFSRRNSSLLSNRLDWTLRDPNNVDGCLILVTYGNDTVAINTLHNSYHFDDILSDNLKYKIEVFAYNAVGRSLPAVLVLDPAAGGGVASRTGPPSYPTTDTQKTLAYILIPVGIALALIPVAVVLVCYVKRRHKSRAAESPEPVYDCIEPANTRPGMVYARPEGTGLRQNGDTHTRNCGVQVNGSGHHDPMSLQALMQAEYNHDNASPYHCNPHGAAELNRLQDQDGQFNQRLKSDSISSYARYDEVDTDCDDVILDEVQFAESEDVLQTSHLDMPKSRNALDAGSSVRSEIPEAGYCAVDVDRYKIRGNGSSQSNLSRMA